jgi:hypothetical protein
MWTLFALNHGKPVYQLPTLGMSAFRIFRSVVSSGRLAMEVAKITRLSHLSGCHHLLVVPQAMAQSESFRPLLLDQDTIR